MTLSSLFVASVVLVIVHLVSGELLLAGLPLLGAFVTGGAITRMVVVPVRRRNTYDD